MPVKSFCSLFSFFLSTVHFIPIVFWNYINFMKNSYRVSFMYFSFSFSPSSFSSVFLLLPFFYYIPEFYYYFYCFYPILYSENLIVFSAIVTSTFRGFGGAYWSSSLEGVITPSTIFFVCQFVTRRLPLSRILGIIQKILFNVLRFSGENRGVH